VKARGSQTILVVDDDEMVRRVAMLSLNQHGYHTMGASDGQSGLMLFIKHRDKIDLVLTDVLMPGVTGPDMVRSILRLDSSAKIVFMSGTAGLAELPRGKHYQMLHKPFTAEGLAKCVRRCLETCT
jgi:two-component system cell cycle sensor histidine kinase/response regulator CckA